MTSNMTNEQEIRAKALELALLWYGLNGIAASIAKVSITSEPFKDIELYVDYITAGTKPEEYR